MTGEVRDPFGLVGSLLDGKHRVDRVVAEGGFGVVYAGRQLRLDIPIAIKVLKPPTHVSPTLRAEVVARFVEEAKTTARVRHPNIAQVLDAGILQTPAIPEGIAWMVLEWLEGETLADELERRRGQGGRSPRECWALVRPVIDAVAYAHDSSVVHRDLKPSNVMLVQDRGTTLVKVVDFGIAKVGETGDASEPGQTTTQSSFTAFSPGYAAPEQISRTRTGPWTDVHALGLMLTEILTDHSAYTFADTTDLYAHVFDDRRPTPARWQVDVGAWEAVIARAVALKPQDRFANARELLDELEQHVGGADARRIETSPTERDQRSLDDARKLRRRMAPEAEPPPSSATVPASHTVRPARKPRWGMLGAGLVAVVVLLLGVYRFAGSQPEPAKPVPRPSASIAETAPVASPQPAAEPTPVLVVQIEPAGATVTVDGRRAEIADGGVAVAGRPGSVHRISVEKGGATRTVDVVVTESGPRPARIALEPAALPRRPQQPAAASAPAAPAASGTARVGATRAFE